MINKIDHFIGELFHKIYLWGGDTMNWIMKAISYLAEAGILFLIIGLVLVLFKKTRRIGGTIILAVAIGFLITNVILKPLINRARPFETIGTDFYKWWLGAGANFESGHSFPSGHTTATTAFAVAIFMTTNKKYNWWILFLPILMACSRIYLMVHYFTDCLGGLIVGTVSAIIIWLLVKWVYSSNIKLFVWAREFDVFKPNQTSQAPKTKKKQKPQQQKVENYVYTTQEEENLQKQEDKSKQSQTSTQNQNTDDTDNI